MSVENRDLQVLADLVYGLYHADSRNMLGSPFIELSVEKLYDAMVDANAINERLRNLLKALKRDGIKVDFGADGTDLHIDYPKGVQA
jgi:hypothetical protein